MNNSNKTFKFKTNINCANCVSAVRPYLDKTIGIINWEVDTSDKNKILTIISDGISKEEIIKIIQNIGYKIELLD